MSQLGEDKAWMGCSLRTILTTVCGPSHASLEKMHPVTIRLPGEAPHRCREQPLTGSVLSETTSCGSCAAAEGLKVDEANQPPASSSSSESPSDEDPKSSMNLNTYNRSAGTQGLAMTGRKKGAQHQPGKTQPGHRSNSVPPHRPLRDHNGCRPPSSRPHSF